MTTIDEQIKTALDTTAASFRRRMAVADLARSDDPRAWHALEQVLGDDDRYLRREVVSSLQRLDDDRVIEPLLRALNDSDDYIRRDAIEGLARHADARAIEPLQALVGTADYSIREAARRALDELQRRGISPAPAPEAPAGMDWADSAADETAPADSRVPESAEPSTATPEVAATVLTQATAEAVPSGGAKTETELPPTGSQEPGWLEPGWLEAGPPPREPAPAALVSPAGPKPAGISPSLEESHANLAGTPDSAGIQFVTAEVVAGAAEPAGALPPVSSSECFLIALPERFDWQRAARMRTLLGDSLSSVTPLYEALAGQQRQLLALDEEHRQAFLELGLQRADKEDDLGRCEDALQAARDDLTRLERAASRADRERTIFDAQARSMWNQFLGAWNAEQTEKNRRSLAEMDDNLRGLRTQIAAVRGRIAELQRQHHELAEPVKQAQTHYESLTGRRDAAADRIRETNEQLDGRLLEILQSLTPDERQARLQQCAALSGDPDFFDLCSGPLMRALAELRAAEAELQAARQQQDHSVSAAQRSLEALGETIAAGFHVIQSPRRTTIRLKGSLRVNEQHGLFEGYSGADGWASGTGSGEAEYELEEVAWTSPANLSEAVQEFAGTWVVSGQQTARHERLAAVVEACERTAAEFVRFLRGELERDFQEVRS